MSGARHRAVGVALLLAALPCGIRAQAPPDTARVNEGYPSLSPDGRYLLYITDADGDYEILRRHVATGRIDTLTRNTAFDYTPVWSPDGQAILFVSDRDGAMDVWEMAADGGSPRPLTRTPEEEEHPRYAPDGRSIVLAVTPAADTGRRFIALLAREGGVPTPVTTDRRVASYPSFDPSGQAIVFRVRQADATGWDLLRRDLATGSERALSPHPANDDYPVWSPTGEWIAFASDRDGAGEPGFDLYLVRPDGSELRRLTHGRGQRRSFYRPSFTADGRRILANRRAGRRLEMVEFAVEDALRSGER